MVAAMVLVIVVLTFVAELWLGLVVTGLHGEQPYIARSENPVKYWLVMAFHLIGATALPLLAYAARI